MNNVEYVPILTRTGEYAVLNRVFSYWSSNIRIFGFIGGRGAGKTYPCKRKCAKDFIFDNKKMVIIRDSVVACDKICELRGDKFWGDVFKNEKSLQNHKAEISGGEDRTILIDEKQCGQVMSLREYYKYKGNYYDCENVLFDEFIQEKQQQYQGNRARQFANTLETLIRKRPNVCVMLTANALDSGNDILELLDFNIKSGQFGLYINKKKQAIIYYMSDSPEYLEAKRKSLSGAITQGTIYDESMVGNRFEDDSQIIFEKRKPCDIFGIYYNLDGECFRLYKSKDSKTFYVCKDINSNSYNYMRYVFNYNQVTPNRQFADKQIIEFLQTLITKKKVQFESKYLINIYMSIINKVKRKSS